MNNIIDFEDADTETDPGVGRTCVANLTATDRKLRPTDKDKVGVEIAA